MHLFTSAEAFPFLAGVFKLAADAEAAATHLDDLLPGLRRQLRLPRMAYVSLTNQGDYLVEVPAGRKDVPKVGAEGEDGSGQGGLVRPVRDLGDDGLEAQQ